MIKVCYQKRGKNWYGAALKDNKVVATIFSDRELDLKKLLKRLPNDSPIEEIKVPDQRLSEVLRGLEDVFNGKNQKTVELGIDFGNVSGYAKKVLECTKLVPVGYVTTYGELAKVAGGSARSVGRVQATNPVPLLIPCHRVVRSDLEVGGYGYGSKVKMKILQKEDRGYEESTDLMINGKKLCVFPVKWVKSKLL